METKNARVFSNLSSMPSVIFQKIINKIPFSIFFFQKIKAERKNWILAGDKHLAEIVSSSTFMCPFLFWLRPVLFVFPILI